MTLEVPFSIKSFNLLLAFRSKGICSWPLDSLGSWKLVSMSTDGWGFLSVLLHSSTETRLAPNLKELNALMNIYLSHFLPVGLGIEGCFSEQGWMLFWGHTELIVERVVPDLRSGGQRRSLVMWYLRVLHTLKRDQDELMKQGPNKLLQSFI